MRVIESLTVPGERTEMHGQRDNGKTFILTEMDAYSGQKWAIKALQVLGSGGLHVDPERLQGGMAALATYAFTALLRADSDRVQGILDELLVCAKYKHADGVPLQAIIPGPKCPVEEITTFWLLYRKLFELHTGFSMPAPTPI